MSFISNSITKWKHFVSFPCLRPHLCLWGLWYSVSQNSWPFLEAGYDFGFPRLGWMWHFHPSSAWWYNGVSDFWDAVPWPHGEVPPAPGARPEVLPSWSGQNSSQSNAMILVKLGWRSVSLFIRWDDCITPENSFISRYMDFDLHGHCLTLVKNFFGV